MLPATYRTGTGIDRWKAIRTATAKCGPAADGSTRVIQWELPNWKVIRMEATRRTMVTEVAILMVLHPTDHW